MEDILAITLLFGGMSAFLLAISPVGRAIADRIRSGPRGADKAFEKLWESHIAVQEELDQLRGELSEVQERLDFTERLLSQSRESDRFPREGTSQGA